MFGDVSNKQRKGHSFSCRHKKRKKGWGGVSEHQEKEEEEEEEEEEGLFKADAVNEEDPERDRATQV